MNCEICEDSGWRCESHPNKPYDHDDCRSAGDPCICNPDANTDGMFSEIIAEA